jgi:DNA modification methylase
MGELSNRVTVVHSDVIAWLESLPDAFLDCAIADAPYGISVTKQRRSSSHWDADSTIAFTPDVWRLLRQKSKPGAILLAFGSPRTSHHQTVAIEQASWRIIDTLILAKGHSFQPGNRKVDEELRRVGAADLAGQFLGHETHLRPGYEPVLFARNLPLASDSLIHAIARGGSGSLNMAKTRIPAGDENRSRRPGAVGETNAWSVAGRETKSVPSPAGRRPSNLLLEHDEACEDDLCSDTCNVTVIDGQGRGKYAKGRELNSRFFNRLRYSPRAPASERDFLPGVTAQTQKPQFLLEWLCDLAVKPGDRVADLFSGSGAVSEAIARAGGHAYAVEKDADLVRLIRARIARLG